MKKIAVIGSGTMGSGIAQVCANSGYHIFVNDISQAILDDCKRRITINQKTLVGGKCISAKHISEANKRIEYTVNIKEAVRNCNLVIEAVPEIMDIKKTIFKQIDQFAPKNAIFISNTSGLSITELATATNRPDKVIGMNWWNPPHIIPLVEIVKGKTTSQRTVDIVFETSKKIGKEPVLVKKPSPGFIGNRIQFAMFREALAILEEGVATAEDIDTAVKAGLGFRLPVIGPLEAADFGGLDVFLNISEYLLKHISNSQKPAKILTEQVSKNMLGIKTGKGFYDYSNKNIDDLIRRRDEKFLELLKIIYK